MTRLEADIATHVSGALERGDNILAEAKPSGGSPRVRDAWNDFATAARRLAEGADTEATINRQLTDIDVYPDGRIEAARATLDEAEHTTRQRAEHAEDALTVLTAVARVAGGGTVDRRREAVARDDARVLLDSAENTGDLIEAATDLASGPDDDIAALMASDWGRRYLKSRGVEDQWGHVTATAMRRNAQRHSDPQVRAAATTWLQRDLLREGALPAYRLPRELSLRAARSELNKGPRNPAGRPRAAATLGH